MPNISNWSENYIYKLERHNNKFNLKNIKAFLKTVGNPQKDLKVIHVAGTNGKGSVCSMIQSSLMQAGYNVGMFTSPHLTKFNERIRINNQLISNKDVNRLTNYVKNVCKKNKSELTFFEMITTIAILYFKEKNPDYVVLETGMGGRLDATNTTKPIISIITSIGKDHKETLGETIREIAYEKAGIIKNKVPVVTSAKGTALKVIRNAAKKKNSKIIIVKTTKDATYQEENKLTAITALRELGVGKEAIKEGMKKYYWPGRFEFVKENILLDCAHNPDGVKALSKSLGKLNYEKLIIIFGMMKRADVKAMCREVDKLKGRIIVTKANMTSARNPEEIAKHLQNSIVTHNLKEAIKTAERNAGKNDLILITGSIFLVGEVMTVLKERKSKKINPSFNI
ncbi:MAG: bifunctional folylpolyglutamate synthase/dihydrofolate synthase [Nanoarchaeota archaeon]|nr:bifunctional folylpolyglutamate synthase/dihydrofolate synthase [Nanoarchaeota archaeon]MBU1270284.1 bifunctional folylpolyglutamate synthase/dihydrofolate synthase [Nanoarchaeota archaeon]MBU1605177.1 bifunctional folylpolyglutamate synthase/dihydrofolate synthase [Nanoarchaeota archaeon]MBU2442535.1 bifunctional folylpolyglutamate synthase/dihydrofolate synthase [Nanoarchaeota archaeon]